MPERQTFTVPFFLVVDRPLFNVYTYPLVTGLDERGVGGMYRMSVYPYCFVQLRLLRLSWTTLNALPQSTFSYVAWRI